MWMKHLIKSDEYRCTLHQQITAGKHCWTMIVVARTLPRKADEERQAQGAARKVLQDLAERKHTAPSHAVSRHSVGLPQIPTRIGCYWRKVRTLCIRTTKRRSFQNR